MNRITHYITADDGQSPSDIEACALEMTDYLIPHSNWGEPILPALPGLEDEVDWALPPEEPDEGMARVMRGGAWTSAGKEVRSGFREGYAPSTDGKKYGVRLARDVEG